MGKEKEVKCKNVKSMQQQLGPRKYTDSASATALSTNAEEKAEQT